MPANTKTYRYSIASKLLNILVLLLMFFIVYSLFKNPHFRDLPLVVVPLAILGCAIYKVIYTKRVFLLYYKIDFDNETLETKGETYNLKTMTTLNIKNIREVEHFTIVYAKPHPYKFDKLVITSDFPHFVELRNHIIDIGKKYDENLYALLKKQSA